MARKTRDKSAKGMGCLALFALPFAGVGAGMAVMLAWTLADHLAMRNWEEVPAQIVQADLDVNHDEDGSTYKATAQYVYTCGGRQYAGSRVSPYSGSDNIGSFQKNAHRELSRHQKSGEPFRCFVDPDNPQESVLYRDLRWEMVGFYTLFVLAFGGVGFGLLIGGLVGWRKARGEAVVARQRPEEPWLWKQEWSTGRIRSSSKTLMYVAIGFAVFWNLISAPIWFIVPGEAIDKKNYLAGLAAIFPVVGIGLAVWALVAVLRWRKYGESVFEMAEVPGVLGGKLAGVIHTTRKIVPEEGFRVVLSCIRKHTSGSGKNRHTSESVVWQDERLMARELAGYDYQKSAIPVLFGIPFDQPETSDEDPNSQVVWRLEASAEVPGIDYAASFDVPVFKTPDSRPDFQLDESLIADYVAPPNPDLDLARAGVIKTISPAGAGARYLFPMTRHFGVVLGLTAFFVIWSGAIALMIHLEAPILFPIVFGLIDLLVAFAVLDLWLYRSVVDVFRHEVAVRGGLLGLGRTRRFGIEKVKNVFLKQGMQSGRTVFYNVCFDLGGGRKVVAGKRLKDKPQAQAVVRELETALGRRDPKTAETTL
jgi:hypothetical protein